MEDHLNHLTPIAKDQFEEAKKIYKTFTFIFPNTYSITFLGKTYLIEISSHYPRQKPDVREKNEVVLLPLPILVEWAPFFQLVHIVDQIKCYSTLTPYPSIQIPDLAAKINSSDINTDDPNEYFNRIDILKQAKQNVQKAKKADSVRETTYNFDEHRALYQKSKEDYEAIQDLKTKVFVTKEDFFQNEIMKLNDSIVKAQEDLDQLQQQLLRGDISVKQTKFIEALAEIKGRDIALRKKKSILQDFLTKRDWT